MRHGVRADKKESILLPRISKTHPEKFSEYEPGTPVPRLLLMR